MDFEDLMPCGECDRCGEYLDHSEMWQCQHCGYTIHGRCRPCQQCAKEAVWEGEALVFKRGAKRKKMESQIVTKDTRIFELEDEVSRLSYLWKSEVNAYTELEAEVERLKDEIVDMLHKERHERNKEDTMADEKNYYCTLERMFQEHMDELQEDSTELDHGFMCGVAAERTIEDISAHVEAISEKHKWGHIEAVNKAFYGG